MASPEITNVHMPPVNVGYYESYLGIRNRVNQKLCILASDGSPTTPSAFLRQSMGSYDLDRYWQYLFVYGIDAVVGAEWHHWNDQCDGGTVFLSLSEAEAAAREVREARGDSGWGTSDERKEDDDFAGVIIRIGRRDIQEALLELLHPRVQDAFMDAAANSADVDLVAGLSYLGADTREVHETGASVVECAAYNPNSNVVACIIWFGVDINATNTFGVTPLMIAAEHNPNPAVIYELIRGGAGSTIYARDQEGRTAFEYADRNPNPAVKQMLIDCTAKLRGSRDSGAE
jgi:hypothetical protein